MKRVLILLVIALTAVGCSEDTSINEPEVSSFTPALHVESVLSGLKATGGKCDPSNLPDGLQVITMGSAAMAAVTNGTYDVEQTATSEDGNGLITFYRVVRIVDNPDGSFTQFIFSERFEQYSTPLPAAPPVKEVSDTITRILAALADPSGSILACGRYTANAYNFWMIRYLDDQGYVREFWMGGVTVMET